jgi:hypothetical protein
MQIAAAIPMVSQNKADTTERSLENREVSQWHLKGFDGKGTHVLGACVNASSRPVMMTKASENATRM